MIIKKFKYILENDLILTKSKIKKIYINKNTIKDIIKNRTERI